MQYQCHLEGWLPLVPISGGGVLRAITHLADEAGGRALAYPQAELSLLPLAELPLSAGGDEDGILIDQRLVEHLGKREKRGGAEDRERKRKRESRGRVGEHQRTCERGRDIKRERRRGKRGKRERERKWRIHEFIVPKKQGFSMNHLSAFLL